MNKKQIERLANKISKITDFNPLTDDLEKLINKIDGRIIYKKDNHKYIALRKLDEKDCEFEIAISSKLDINNLKKIRFLIAIELGHLFLHMGYLISENLWESQETLKFFKKYNGKMDYEAREFAINLLMPRELFESEVAQNARNGKVYLEELSDKFSVEIDLIDFRGQSLNCFKTII